MDLDYKIYCKPMLNLWNCRGFIIQTLSDYHVVVEGCKKYIAQRKDNPLLGLIVQCEVQFSSVLYNSTIDSLNLSTGIKMHITYSNISNQDNIMTKITPYWNLSEYDNEIYMWEDVFQDDSLVSTTSTSLVIFDGVKVTSNTKYLVLDHVILIYIPNMLSEDIYKSTCRLANVYYEGAPLYGNKSKKKAKNSQRGYYKNISHGYSSNAGINATGNVVPCHSSKITLHEEKAFKDIGDEIASNIWKTAMSTFVQKIDHHFH